MLENAWKVFLIGKQKDGAKFFTLFWTMTKSKRKNWKIKVNCQKYAIKLLENPISYGQ